jgi:hypothetical protein
LIEPSIVGDPLCSGLESRCVHVAQRTPFITGVIRRGSIGAARESHQRWASCAIWKHDLDKGLRILRLGIETHVITSHYLLPLLVDRPGGLVVEITDGTFEYNATHCFIR